MERRGLVSQVEAELEKMLSLELLPAHGKLPSENKLARCFGVSRGTVREALLKLKAKGLVVTHPGRQARRVPLSQSMSLENLGVLLEGDGKLYPERWTLLEGYLALKRELTVELLAACCEEASAQGFEQVAQACFALRERAQWDSGERTWVAQEFDVLRLAAMAAQRPGHLLLIHSLERSFLDMAKWMQPHLDSKAVEAWAWCAMKALGDRDAQTLRSALPPLLHVADERLLSSLVPPSQQPVAPSESHSVPSAPQACEPLAPEATQAGGAGEVCANLSDSRTGSREVSPTGAPVPEAASEGVFTGPEPAVRGEDGALTQRLQPVRSSLAAAHVCTSRASQDENQTRSGLVEDGWSLRCTARRSCSEVHWENGSVDPPLVVRHLDKAPSENVLERGRFVLAGGRSRKRAVFSGTCEVAAPSKEKGWQGKALNRQG